MKSFGYCSLRWEDRGSNNNLQNWNIESALASKQIWANTIINSEIFDYGIIVTTDGNIM